MRTYQPPNHPVLGCVPTRLLRAVLPMLACWQCWRASNVDVVPISARFQCRRAGNVGALAMAACFQCWCAGNVCVLPMLVCWQCWCAAGSPSHCGWETPAFYSALPSGFLILTHALELDSRLFGPRLRAVHLLPIRKKKARITPAAACVPFRSFTTYITQLGKRNQLVLLSSCCMAEFLGRDRLLKRNVYLVPRHDEPAKMPARKRSRAATLVDEHGPVSSPGASESNYGSSIHSMRGIGDSPAPISSSSQSSTDSDELMMKYVNARKRAGQRGAAGASEAEELSEEMYEELAAPRTKLKVVKCCLHAPVVMEHNKGDGGTLVISPGCPLTVDNMSSSFLTIEYDPKNATGLRKHISDWAAGVYTDRVSDGSLKIPDGAFIDPSSATLATQVRANGRKFDTVRESRTLVQKIKKGDLAISLVLQNAPPAAAEG